MGYYIRLVVHKGLITNMNAHLRVRWCKKISDIGSAEMWTEVIWSDESSCTPQEVKHICGV